MWLLQSPVNPKPWAPSHGPPARVLSPLFFLAKSLLLPKPRGKKKHPKTSWSSLLSFRTAWSFFPFQNCVALSLSPQNRVVFSYSLQNRVAPYLLQSRVVYSLFTSELHGLLFTSEPHGPLPFPSEPRGSPLRSRTVWPPIYFRAAWSTLYGCRA